MSVREREQLFGRRPFVDSVASSLLPTSTVSHHTYASPKTKLQQLHREVVALERKKKKTRKRGRNETLEREALRSSPYAMAIMTLEMIKGEKKKGTWDESDYIKEMGELAD